MLLKSADSGCSVRNQYFAAILMALNTMNYGCLAGWLSPVIPLLKSENSPFGRPLNENEFSLMASLVCIGALVGIGIFGYISDRFGRKIAALCCVIPFILCWCLKLFSGNVNAVLVGRFLAGAGGAGAMNVTPVYIREIASDEHRGKLTSLSVVFVNVGILYAYLGGAYLSYVPFMCYLLLIPLTYCTFCYWIPETPAYLIKNGEFAKAQSAVAWLRRVPEDCRTVQQVMTSLKQEDDVSAEDINEITSMKSTFLSAPFWKLLGVVLTLINIQSFVGTYAIVNYSSQIFEDAGGSLSSNESAIVMACEQLAGSYISFIFIEKLGRKPLLIMSALFVAVGMGIFGWYLYMKHINYDLSSLGWVPITALSLAIMMNSVGLGPMPFIITAEGFNTKMRNTAMTIVIFMLWVDSFVVSQFYSSAVRMVGEHGTFWLFSGVAVFGVVFGLLCVPETKGNSVNKINKSQTYIPESDLLI